MKVVRHPKRYYNALALFLAWLADAGTAARTLRFTKLLQPACQPRRHAEVPQVTEGSARRNAANASYRPSDNEKGDTMNLHARDIEPDLGPLLELANDLPEQDASGHRRTEPRLEGDSRKRPGLAFGPMDRIGQEGALPARQPMRRGENAAPSGSTLLALWGGFWRAVVIGVVSGTVGGVIGAFTLVWLTGAGWTTFAKLLIDAISGT